MAVYLVTWDLNKEKPNYAEARKQFIAHLERYENTKDSGLDSVRFVSTDLSARQLSDDLRKKLDENDRIIVTKLVLAHYSGWLQENVWTWINARL